MQQHISSKDVGFLSQFTQTDIDILRHSATFDYSRPTVASNLGQITIGDRRCSRCNFSLYNVDGFPIGSEQLYIEYCNGCHFNPTRKDKVLTLQRFKYAILDGIKHDITHGPRNLYLLIQDFIKSTSFSYILDNGASRLIIIPMVVLLCTKFLKFIHGCINKNDANNTTTTTTATRSCSSSTDGISNNTSLLDTHKDTLDWLLNIIEREGLLMLLIKASFECFLSESGLIEANTLNMPTISSLVLINELI